MTEFAALQGRMARVLSKIYLGCLHFERNSKTVAASRLPYLQLYDYCGKTDFGRCKKADLVRRKIITYQPNITLNGRLLVPGDYLAK